MAEPLNPEEIKKALEKQIADLRKEMSEISKTLSERGAELYDSARGQAEETMDEASQKARRAMRQLRTTGGAVSELARENPATATTIVVLSGLVGFLLGLAVASATAERRRWL